MITDYEIEELSAKFKIDGFTIIREYLQLLFLRYLYSLKDAERLYFKGGTAIHFFYGSFRFSEDLDFTSALPPKKLPGLLAQTMKLLQSEVEGLELKDIQKKKNSLTGSIKYSKGKAHPLNIRLDFSFREKPITKIVAPIETPFPIAAYPLVIHLSAEEILAEKIRAVLSRGKGRDVFDIWFLLSKGISVKRNYIEKKMRWYKMTFSGEKLIKAIESFKEKELRDDLGKFLPKDYRPFIRDLKGEVLKKLKAVLE